MPLPVYRQVGSKLGNYEKSLEEIMEGATGTGDFGKVPVTSSDTEAIKRSIKGTAILWKFPIFEFSFRIWLQSGYIG